MVFHKVLFQELPHPTALLMSVVVLLSKKPNKKPSETKMIANDLKHRRG